MSALVRKELRALLPPWLLAMILAIVPVWLAWPGPRGVYAPSPGYIVEAPFALGVLLLSLTPFGQELNWGTFSILLAQPVPRSRIWRVKTLLLATALLLVFLAYFFSSQLRVNALVATDGSMELRSLLTRPGLARQVEQMMSELRHNVVIGALMVGGLGALAGFAGGLWTTLLFRQVSAAFWFTLLIPISLSLLAGLAGVEPVISGVTVGDLLTCIVLGLYSAAGFFWAQRQFQRVQDAQWTGGVVSLPAWGTAEQTDAIGRKRQPLRAFLLKEFQAQYVNLLLAAGLLVIHLVVVLVRRMSANYMDTHRSMAMILESFPVLWLVIPLMVGSVAIAEERKLGMFETVSCLPLSRRVQFVIKLLIALVLGLVLGALVPSAIEQLAGPAGLHVENSFAFGVRPESAVPLLNLAIISSLGISLLACYGSSLTRNTLQALGAAVLACIIASLVATVVAVSISVDGVYLWGRRLLTLALVPVMVLAIIVLAYRNYRRIQVTARAWGRNGVVLLALLLGTTSIVSAVYHRLWEIWMPLEPPHSWAFFVPRQTTQQPSHTKLNATSVRVAAVLADGRLWLRQRPVALLNIVHDGKTYSVPQAKGRLHQGFLPGSNWRDVAVSDYGSYGLQADGSLWDLSVVQPGSRSAGAQLKRVGESHDWAQLTGGGPHYCAIKTNGTLWAWGYHWGPTGQSAALELPTQVGTDSHWLAVADSFQSSVAFTADGTVWRWGWVQNWTNDNLGKAQFSSEPEKWLAFPGPRRPVSVSYNGHAVAAVCDDGTLWLGGHLLNSLLGREAVRAREEMVRWGNESDWHEVVFPGTIHAAAVKRNGSLFALSEGPIFWRDGSKIPFDPLSEYPVWTSVCSYGGAFLSLGRDGSLCVWGNPHQNYSYAPRDNPEWLLALSRIRAREMAKLSH